MEAVVRSAINGQNACILGYGQTGSGKVRIGAVHCCVLDVLLVCCVFSCSAMIRVYRYFIVVTVNSITEGCCKFIILLMLFTIYYCPIDAHCNW